MSDYVPVKVQNLLFALLPILLDEEEPIPYHNSILTGSLRYQELIETRNPHKFRDECRMDKPTFLRLLNKLKTEGGLEDSKHLCAGEK